MQPVLAGYDPMEIPAVCTLFFSCRIDLPEIIGELPAGKVGMTGFLLGERLVGLRLVDW